MDLTAVEVAFRMFERWRQENFFKYLGAEFALDVLVDYQVQPDDPARQVPNPARKAIDQRLRAAQAKLNALRADFGIAAFLNVGELERHTGPREPRCPGRGGQARN